MQIRTQVYCFSLFLVILMTASLVHSQATGGPATARTEPPRAADPATFCAAVAQQFQAPVPQVSELVAQGLPPEEVVVVYFLAEHSLRPPAEIVAERRAGRSWREIARTSGVVPEELYYPAPSTRRPFVNVYAIYHAVPRDHWSWDRIQLADADVENLVNLRFLAALGGPAPGGSALGRPSVPDILRLRSQGYDYVSIHHFLLGGQQTAERVAGPARAGLHA